jgi:integrase
LNGIEAANKIPRCISWRCRIRLAEGLITIRESKFDKSRVVPLHPTTVKALAAYKVRRDAFLKRTEAFTFFISERRGPISNLHVSFREIRRAAELERIRNGIRPRMHDLRHTFAVRTLLSWYRDGARCVPLLPFKEIVEEGRPPQELCSVSPLNICAPKFRGIDALGTCIE